MGAPLVDVDSQAADARPECNVLRDGHVPEQRIALEHETDLPLLHRHLRRVLIWQQQPRHSGISVPCQNRTNGPTFICPHGMV